MAQRSPLYSQEQRSDLCLGKMNPSLQEVHAAKSGQRFGVVQGLQVWGLILKASTSRPAFAIFRSSDLEQVA